MRRKTLTNWFEQSGFDVQIRNELVRFERGDDLLYLQNQWYYPKWYLRIIFFVYRDMWGDAHWKTAYQQCINNSPINNSIMAKYTHQQIKSYLAKFYSPSYRKSGKDHYYNFRNRDHIAVPINQTHFSETEVLEMFGDKTALPLYAEIARFNQFLTSQK